MSMWNLVQQVQIRHVSARQTSADTNAGIVSSQNRRRDEDLEDSIDRLTLVVEALWELLSERTGITVAELVAKVREVDGRDGAVDGLRGPRPGAQRQCPQCQAVVPASMPNCQFCGAATPGSLDPFEL